MKTTSARIQLSRQDATLAHVAPEDSGPTLALDGALRTLLSEVENLREEVGRLKAKLAEAEALADRDPLTPLLNRRAFVREVGRVAAHARRYAAPASLVLFDLDGFKRVNDRLGHAAGDAALLAVALRLVARVRESDVVGRLGGDEFGVILVQADRATAEAKARALASAIESEPVTVGAQSVALQISYGVHPLDREAKPEALLAEADAAMFAHKRARRATRREDLRR